MTIIQHFEIKVIIIRFYMTKNMHIIITFLLKFKIFILINNIFKMILKKYI